MPYPTEPKKVRIHDRIVAVLDEIVAGDVYFYTPANVQGKPTMRLADYSLEVLFAGAEEPPVRQAGLVVQETFTVIVDGHIRDRDGETQKALARALRDVRTAILEDGLSSAAGSLQSLVISIQLGAWSSWRGEGTFEGLGNFSQEFKITVNGDIKDL